MKMKRVAISVVVVVFCVTGLFFSSNKAFQFVLSLILGGALQDLFITFWAAISERRKAKEEKEKKIQKEKNRKNNDRVPFPGVF